MCQTIAVQQTRQTTGEEHQIICSCSLNLPQACGCQQRSVLKRQALHWKTQDDVTTCTCTRDRHGVFKCSHHVATLQNVHDQPEANAISSAHYPVLAPPRQVRFSFIKVSSVKVVVLRPMRTSDTRIVTGVATSKTFSARVLVGSRLTCVTRNQLRLRSKGSKALSTIDYSTRTDGFVQPWPNRQQLQKASLRLRTEKPRNTFHDTRNAQQNARSTTEERHKGDWSS